MSEWKQVPMEPTDEQWSAALRATGEQLDFGAIYRAMLEAAPTPPEPSAEAAEAVARAIFPQYWEKLENGSWMFGEHARQQAFDVARTALAADPLRRELGELAGRWQERAREMRMGNEDSGISNAMAIDADVHEDCADELAALLEKHA